MGTGFRTTPRGGAAMPPYTNGPYTFSEDFTFEGLLTVDGHFSAGSSAAVSGTLAVTGAQTNVVGLQTSVVAVTGATAGGDISLGVIPDGTSFVSVTSTDANLVVSLPTPTPGNVVQLVEPAGGAGYELRSNAPASVAINSGIGSSAESPIGSAVGYVKCVCVGATAWVCTAFSVGGSADTIAAAA